MLKVLQIFQTKIQFGFSLSIELFERYKFISEIFYELAMASISHLILLCLLNGNILSTLSACNSCGGTTTEIGIGKTPCRERLNCNRGCCFKICKGSSSLTVDRCDKPHCKSIQNRKTGTCMESHSVFLCPK